MRWGAEGNATCSKRHISKLLLVIRLLPPRSAPAPPPSRLRYGFCLSDFLPPPFHLLAHFLLPSRALLPLDNFLRLVNFRPGLFNRGLLGGGRLGVGRPSAAPFRVLGDGRRGLQRWDRPLSTVHFQVVHFHGPLSGGVHFRGASTFTGRDKFEGRAARGRLGRTRSEGSEKMVLG